MRVGALVVIALGLLVGCAAVPAPARKAALVASPAAATAAAPAAYRYELRGYGFSAKFAAPPHFLDASEEGDGMPILVSGGEASFSLFAVSAHSHDRPKDQDWYDALRKKLQLEQRAEVNLGGLKGVELAGLVQGRSTLTRLFATGDTLLGAQVIAEGPLDEKAAARFFDSLRFEQGFRIFASPKAKLSVRVPANAIEVDHDGLSSDRRNCRRAFVLGGADNLSYWVTAEEIVSRSEELTDDQLLELGITSMQKDGTRVTWQGPAQMHGARARDFLASTAGNHAFMGRIWLTPQFVYMLMVSANSRDALQGADVASFYDSAVWY